MRDYVRVSYLRVRTTYTVLVGTTGRSMYCKYTGELRPTVIRILGIVYCMIVYVHRHQTGDRKKSFEVGNTRELPIIAFINVKTTLGKATAGPRDTLHWGLAIYCRRGFVHRVQACLGASQGMASDR